MITKELLSEVLGENVTLVNGHISGGNTITYYTRPQLDGQADNDYINIHELATRCKERAYYSYGVMIQSYLYNNKWRVDILKSTEINEFFKGIDTEPEAIFKAYEWVRENR